MATSNCFVRLVALPVIEVMYPGNVCFFTVTCALWKAGRKASDLFWPIVPARGFKESLTSS